MKTWNNILYNLVGIIKLSVTLQDQNTIDDTLLIITKTWDIILYDLLSIMKLSVTVHDHWMTFILFNRRHRDG